MGHTKNSQTHIKSTVPHEVVYYTTENNEFNQRDLKEYLRPKRKVGNLDLKFVSLL